MALEMTSEVISVLRGESLKKWLKDRRVAVMGLGQSGIAAARVLLKFGAKLFLSETQPKKEIFKNLPGFLHSADAEFGCHSKAILNSDLIVVSPGIDWGLPLLVEARKKRVPVWGELELGYRLADLKQIAAVTGTNGKTTTVSLLGDICARSGRKTFVGGNTGNPLCNFCNSTDKFELAILEVSSYQLEGIETFHPQISVALNLTSDHLRRHGSMQGYARAKERIFLNQNFKDAALLNADDTWCRKMSAATRLTGAEIVWFSTRKKVGKGVFFDAQRKRIVAQCDPQRAAMNFPLPAYLPGIHNVENSCAAIAASLRLKIPVSVIRKSLENFKGVEHRLENFLNFKGIAYINDSKSTNVASTLKALQSFSVSIWLIMGGQDKGSPYLPLKAAIAGKVKGIFLIGEASKKIYSELQGACKISFSKTLERAVVESSSAASPGDAVLLSPACASFDQFKNYEDRGRQFKELVKKLK